MKVSLHIVKYYGNGFDPLADGGVAGVVERVGAQLGAIEDVVQTGPRYDGIVVARVVACDKHPNADKLHVCKVDDGGAVHDVARDAEGLVQVVCGAPNVRSGMTVAWLPPGSTVPVTYDDDEPFVLSARELRGVISNGMLASASELGLSDDHSGLLEITTEDVGVDLTKPGTPFRKLYDLDDVILDLENKMFTHRPDCFGAIGVARELAGIAGSAFTSPDWYKNPVSLPAPTAVFELRVSNEAKAVVPRFMAQVVRDVTVQPSPMWLQAYLARVGVKSINNIVDLTNYYMLLTGQPLHAFDYDKLVAHSTQPTLGPRMAKEGEELTLLGGKTVKLTSGDIVIATDTQAVALAGVMGGAETEVDSTTKNIVIECATFDMYSIRRTSMRYGLFTDAVTRYTKGQSPLQNDRVLAKIVDDLMHVADGSVASDVFDLLRQDVKPMPAVHVSVRFINDRLGSTLTSSQMKKMLENVEFVVEVDAAHEELMITPPFWRTDIELSEDLVEEIGRLYGYSKLPINLPVRPSMPVQRDTLLQLKAQIRTALKAMGANEVLGYSFVHEKTVRAANQNPVDAFKLSNALSPDLQYYRLSLTPSLLEKIQPNIRAGYEQFALYEIGKGHDRRHIHAEDDLPDEHELLSLVFAANAKTAGQGAPFYRARALLDTLGSLLGTAFVCKQYAETPEQLPLYGPYDRSRCAQVYTKFDHIPVGVIGEFSATARRAFKLPVACAGFELDLKMLSQASGHKRQYEPLPRFPKVTQDISLKVPTTVTYEDIRMCLEEALSTAQPHATRYSLEPVDIYVAENGDRHIAFRLMIAHYERTMTTDEVNQLLDIAAAAASGQYAATRL